MAQSTYAYKVRDSDGKLIQGTLDADDASLVATRLRQMGYVPISIEARNASAMKKEIRIPGLSGRVPLKIMAVFSRQFATLITSGLTLLRALAILAEQTEHKELARIVAEVRAEVEKGLSLSQSLAKHPRTFSNLFIAMVRAGEASGALDQSLLSLASMMEKQATLRGKIKSALAYPVTVLSLVVVILAAIILFIVPVFKNIYAQLHGTLPLPTRILMVASSWAVKLIVPMLLLATVAIVLVTRWLKTPNGKTIKDITLLRVPIFGTLMRKTAVERFASTLSSLLKAGVPLLESLEITKETVNNVVVGRAIDAMSDGVRRGEPLAARLGDHAVLPPMIAQMMAVGEETGALDSLLARASVFLEEEITRMVESLTSLLEPLMIVVLGGAVGSMVICLYLPMFNVTKLINGNS